MALFSKEEQQKVTPKEVLQELIEGNTRFCTNTQLQKGSL